MSCCHCVMLVKLLLSYILKLFYYKEMGIAGAGGAHSLMAYDIVYCISLGLNYNSM